jgi:hypothetical protein
MDATTQGAWKGVYGSLGIGLYPDGGSGNFPPSFVRGAGTQFNGPMLTFEPQFPQRYTGANCCSPVTGPGGLVVGTGQAWPANARFNAGFYNRVADGVPFRTGLTLPAARRVRLYFVDYDRRGRVQKIDVYAEGAVIDDPSGSLGVAHANGPLLDSRTIDHFESGIYLVWDITGPMIFQITPIAPIPADGPNGIAVLSGAFLDPAEAPR